MRTHPRECAQESAPVAVSLQPMGHAVWYRVRAAEVPAGSEVSGLSLLVKKQSLYPLGRPKPGKAQGPQARRINNARHTCPACTRAVGGGGGGITSLPSRLRESPRDFINSRDIYRQPSSWGCWEPGRPPEPFPFSCPSFSLSSLFPLLRKHLVSGLRASPCLGACRALVQEDSLWWREGGGPGQTVAASSRGRGPGRGSSWHPVDSRPTAVPAKLFADPGSREPATGASHRGPRGRRAE